MKPTTSTLALALVLAAALPAAELEVEITNQLSKAGPPPISSPTSGATAGQFRSAAITNGGLHHATTPGSTTPVNPAATGGSYRLTRAVIGPSFVSGVPDFAFGEVITPPDELGWRNAPVAPGETVKIAGQFVVPVPPATERRYYYSIHAEQVFAVESGSVDVVWRSRLADQNGNFTISRNTYIVSPVPSRQTRRVFWTEVPYNGPVVPLPAGIETVHIAYRERFPASLADENAADPSTAPRLKTFWLDELPGSKTFRAQVVEGRLFVEFLGETRNVSTGARVSLTTEIIDVLAEPVPAATSFTLTAFLGDRLLPSDGDTSLVADVKRGLGQSPPFVANRPVEGVSVIFAERFTANANDVLIFWKEKGLLGTEWPRFRNTYNLRWPTDPAQFALNALPAIGDSTQTSVDLKSGNTPTLVYQDTSGEAQVDVARFKVELDPAGDGRNRSLLLFQADDQFWYQRVLSAEHTQFGSFPPALLTAFDGGLDVGQRATPPAGYGDDVSRAAYVLQSRGNAYNPNPYLDPVVAGFEDAEFTSEVIPVNALPSNNALTLFWFRKQLPPTPEFKPIHWPAIVANYNLAWPTQPREIVMASNAGSGELPPAESTGLIYYQNDPTATGYNPNEEHAIMLAGRAYSLRDDLNIPAVSSEPFVLTEYVAADERTAMGVFRVLREDVERGITFEYDAIAGTRIGAPAPLSLLPLPLDPVTGVSANVEVFRADPDAGNETPSYYDGFTFQDRKGDSWIYRGPHAGTAGSALYMQFFYKTQPGFAFPDPVTAVDAPPPVGTIEPFLREPDGSGGYLDDPIEIAFIPVWPEIIDPAQPELDDPSIPNAPILEFADTLTKAKFGLPAVRGQTSARIIYEQSRALDPAGARQTAVLFDPTRAKTHRLRDGALEAIPPDIATDSRNGRSYFQKLPPHLKERFYFDPNIGELGALVLLGEFVDDIVGEDYLLLNVLSAQDLLTIQNLSTDSNWDTAAENLTTAVETFIENPAVAGTYIPTEPVFLVGSSELAVVTDSNQAVDSYAMTSVGGGSGYVSLIFGDGEAFTPEAEPVSVAIIHVGGSLHRGQVKPILSSNPLDEQVTLRHTGDFAGFPENYQFEWRYQPPVNGVVADIDYPADSPGPGWIVPNGSPFENQFIVKGSPPLLSLGDNYWTMRFRPVDPAHPVRATGADGWSPWTEAALVEGWIKRVLAGINPFNQRVTDFFNSGIDTNVSILTQAGPRWEGDIALNLANINEFGLIEIYETVLNRGIGISIGGTPATDYGPANDALLLASGYLADLYTILGDEAFADASNPTIAFDAQAIGSVADSSVAVDFESVFSETATARFAFQGQAASLLEEELGLLRGRDDTASPGVEISPTYNRLFWNYTRGITAGEVIYALNYNIRERTDADSDGTINAADAARQYPQAHGDAYGHYLTAVSNYYRLLTDSDFTWAPRVEAVNVLGVPVQVDYFDERKFATAASRVAKTALQTAGLVHRETHTDDRSAGWAHFRDGTNPNVNFRDGRTTSPKRTRHWGLDEWTTRGIQGAYFNWVVANSILPAEDTIHTGIQKIDRTTVPELAEITTVANALQAAADNANAFLNPLGLGSGSQLFDLDPSELADGSSHFEQVFARTTASLNNAFDTFDQATASTRLLRSLENQADDLSAAVFDQEGAFTGQLREIYGTPYAGDIGVGKAYPQGYSGPDLFRYFYIDNVSLITDPFPTTPTTVTLDVPSYVFRHYTPADPDETANFSTVASNPVSFTVDPESDVQYATPAMGRRQTVGQIQIALQQVAALRETLAADLDEYQRGKEVFDSDLRIFNEAINTYQENQRISKEVRDDIEQIEIEIAGLKAGINGIDFALETYDAFSSAGEAGVPALVGIILGFSNGTFIDPRPIPSTIAKFGKAIATSVAGAAKFALDTAADARGVDASFLSNDLGIRLEAAGFPEQYLRMAADLQASYYTWYGNSSGIDQRLIALSQARANVDNLIAKGSRLQSSREIFRRRAAAAVQGYRTRDVAFRAFRTESLEQYQTLLDWAARYTYLTAKAYDYETGLLQSPEGHAFLNAIVASRALGLRNDDGDPIFGASETGDPGLSGLLAQLDGDWSSVASRLGFNNPDQYGTVFSLRHELFRVPADTPPSDGDPDANNDSPADRTWREHLQTLIVDDLRTDPDIATHCLQIDTSDTPVPGIVIPFSSTITDSLNFFGNPLAGGDHAYSSTSFATKIHSVGTVLTGYVGMDPYAVGQPGAGGPATGDPNALSATPYVYLIATGADVLRTPPIGGGGNSTTRTYNVQDFAMPLPFNIGGSPFNPEFNWTGNDTLNNEFLTPRKHQAFRAVDDPAFFYSNIPEAYTNNRLVGRSAWNTGWKLVIPAETLLNNPAEGLDRFLKSVTDIKLYLRTYSYSGN